MARILILAILLISLLSGVFGQQEILSISSFVPCVDIDSRLGLPNYDPATTNINCGPPGQVQPDVTVLNLLFSPNVGSEANFTFNLTVVAGSANTVSNTTSSQGTTCQTQNSQFDLCTLTTPAVINIKSSRLVYKYRLNIENNNLIPYCYASTSLREGYKNINKICGTTDIPNGCTVKPTGVLDCSSTEADACIPIQNTKPVTSTTLKNKINQMAGAGLTDQFKLSSFERVQQPFFPVVAACSNTQGDPVYWNLNSYGGDYSYVFERQGNLQGWYDPNNINRISQFFTPPASNANYCELYQNQQYNDLYYDSPNVDVRIPTIYPQPSIFGMTPSPVYRNLVTDPINGNPDLIIPPVNITNFNFITGSVSFSCAGFDCAANQDERKQIKSSLGVTSAPFATGVHSIVGLAPYCAIYDLNVIPEVFAEIDIEVIINPGTPQQSVETVTISNFNPSTSQRSLPHGFVFGQIEAITSSNFIIGPAIQGAVIICGEAYDQYVNGNSNQNNDNTFPNMQCLSEGVVCDDTGSVDLANSPTFSEANNPWQTIINQSKSEPGLVNRTSFYPHPYDYMIPDLATNGKNPSFTSIPGNHGETFWYFVDSNTLANQFGKSCNQIGLAVGGNSIQQNANLWCNIDAHECLPGLGKTINGGQKNALPCIVSQYFNLASGLYDGINLPFPLGTAGLNPADLPNYQFDSATYIEWMRANASNFVPFNPFISDKTNSPLYDPSNPQFWLGKEGGTGAPYLYYSPTVSSNGVTESLSSVGINLVLDVAGNFVQYSVAVAKGEIDLTKSNCSLNQGSVGTTSIAVKNPSQSTTTTYVLDLDCNPAAPYSNSITLVVSDNDQTVVLGPGQEVVVNFTVSSPQNQPITNSLTCIATLSYAELATATSDRQVIQCSYLVTDIPQIFQSGLPTPPNTAPTKYANTTCTGFCNLPCRVAQGIIYDDGCFWIIVIFCSAILISMIVAISILISVCLKYRALRLSSQQEGQNFLKEQISET